MTKLTIIGAGSAVFTKNIVADLLSLDVFKNMEISLQDIDPVRLKASHELLKVISHKLNASPKITSHTDRKKSLAGSDFVQTTIQVGGYKPATIIDFEIPREFGLKQTIADTLGIGGIMRGLRTIPVLLDIAKDVMEICPNAIWLQYVNPMCANMIAINNCFPNIKTIGLCHSVQGTAEMLAKDLGENIEDIDYLCAGINHMAFYKKFEKKSRSGKNEDLYPLIAAGVPTLRLHQDGRDYFDLHHTADDTVDKLDAAALDQNVAAFAVFAWLVADSDVTFRAVAPQ